MASRSENRRKNKLVQTREMFSSIMQLGNNIDWHIKNILTKWNAYRILIKNLIVRASGCTVHYKNIPEYTI